MGSRAQQRKVPIPGRRGSGRAARGNHPQTLGGRLNAFLPRVAAAHVITLALLILFGLIGVLFAGEQFSALAAAVAQMWFGLHLVPVTAGEGTLGALPLVPPMLLVAFVARRVFVAVRDRVSISDLAVLAGCVILLPLVLTAIAMWVVHDASSQMAVAVPNAGAALARVAAIHALAFLLGLGGRLWRALLRRYGLPEWLLTSFGVAARYLGILLLAGVTVAGLVMALNHRVLSELFGLYDAPGAAVGLVVISLLYLPNAALSAASVLLGGEFHFGEESVSLFGVHPVALPPFPLLTALPTSVPEYAWALLFIPVSLAAVLAYRDLQSIKRPVVAALCSGVMVAAMMAILAWLVTGQVGFYGTVGPLLGLTAGLAGLWLGGIGAAASLVHHLLAPKPNDAADAAPDAPSAAAPDAQHTPTPGQQPEKEAAQGQAPEAAPDTGEEPEEHPEPEADADQPDAGQAESGSAPAGESEADPAPAPGAEEPQDAEPAADAGEEGVETQQPTRRAQQPAGSGTARPISAQLGRADEPRESEPEDKDD